MFSLRRALILSVCSALFVSMLWAGPVEDMITFVTVGDPRNPDEDTTGLDAENAGVGYVAQAFAMGQTEVTNEMYARFLNAVAKDDRLYGLYSTFMASNEGGILRTGLNGAYLYTVKAGFAARPVNFVSAFDAMRFCNWLHNGMPSGAQTAQTTEDGAYTLLGANDRQVIRRNAGAKYFLPDQDEWHKAAYYSPNPGTDPFTGLALPSQSYWKYSTQRNEGFLRKDQGYFPTAVALGKEIDIAAAPVAVKGYPASFYGTYDQDGNVGEWTDSSISASGRAVAGLKKIESDVLSQRSYSAYLSGTELVNLGFRVAKTIPAESPQGQALLRPVLVRVGEEANPGDPLASNAGAVNYAYQIGAYEITNAEYAIFLNAVAKADPYGLYSVVMSLSSRGGIERAGRPGAYVYTVKTGYERLPVNLVTLQNAMRFCNWLHNGATATADTEDGAYRLLGSVPPNTANIQRNTGARYFLPSLNEWHKAAYYEPFPANRPSASYWTYAVRSDAALPERINFENQYEGPTQVAFLNFPSYFGTFGQNGNVQEILENGSVAGGSWSSVLSGLSGTRFAGSATFQPSAETGFRIGAVTGVVSGELPPVPEPPVVGEPLLRPQLTRVGLPFNLGDDFGSDEDMGEVDEKSNRGAVPYEFQIGTYEVTNEEFVVFLNAVARFDTYRIYNTLMGQPLTSENNRKLQGGILRAGQNGAFVYSVRPGFAKKPVNFLDPYTAMRFCNWLHNGAQPGGDTENGAYALRGRIWQGEKGGGGSVDIYPARSASARYYIPTLHEWHKAAYYDPAPTGKPSASYWSYATRSDFEDVWPENYKNRFGGLVDVDYFRRTSYFGTIGQGGNIAELTITTKKTTDATGGDLLVAFMGGHWDSQSSSDLSSQSDPPEAQGKSQYQGLRLAAAINTVSGLPAPKGSAVQQIDFKLPASKRMGPAFKISATSTSRRPVRFESSDPSIAMVSSGGRFNYVFLRSPGTVVITAYEDGDGVWSPAQVSRTLEVLPRAGLRRR